MNPDLRYFNFFLLRLVLCSTFFLSWCLATCFYTTFMSLQEVQVKFMWRSWCLRRIEWDASNSAKYYLVEIYYIVNQSGTNRHSTLMFSIYKKYYIHTYIPTTLLSTQLPSWVRYPKENSIILQGIPYGYGIPCTISTYTMMPPHI